MLKNTSQQYGCIAKLIHGLLALIIILQLMSGLFNDYIPHQFKGIFFLFHKSFGIVIFFLMCFFIVWCWLNAKPAWPTEMKMWEKILAKLVHRLLYILFLVMPLTGWIMSTAAGKTPSFFGLFLAPFPFVSINQPLAYAMVFAHEIIAWIVLALISLHVLGALKHHCCDKNAFLRRMF